MRGFFYVNMCLHEKKLKNNKRENREEEGGKTLDVSWSCTKRFRTWNQNGLPLIFLDFWARGPENSKRFLGRGVGYTIPGRLGGYTSFWVASFEEVDKGLDLTNWRNQVFFLLFFLEVKYMCFYVILTLNIMYSISM